MDDENNLEKFLKELNRFYPNIRFTFEKSKKKVNFLDIATEIKNERLSTDLCSKLLDSYQYLHYNSCHDKHIKKIITYIQILSLRKIFSERKDLRTHVEDLKVWFLRR